MKNTHFREQINTSWYINSDIEQITGNLDLKIELVLFLYISSDCVFIINAVVKKKHRQVFSSTCWNNIVYNNNMETRNNKWEIKQ